MKVINFFGAPGVGKSTHTMDLTSMLKKTQIDAEPSLEVVKEYIHSNSEHLLAYQNYIFAQQERQLSILKNSNEVEFAITDAPLLHCPFYAPQEYPVFFKELVFEIFHGYDNVNFFINRKHSYSHQGRIHSEKESTNISKKLHSFLINHNIKFIEIDSTQDVSKIFKYIIENHRVDNYEIQKRQRK